MKQDIKTRSGGQSAKEVSRSLSPRGEKSEGLREECCELRVLEQIGFQQIKGRGCVQEGEKKNRAKAGSQERAKCVGIWHVV